jgi:hypothetical protein
MERAGRKQGSSSARVSGRPTSGAVPEELAPKGQWADRTPSAAKVSLRGEGVRSAGGSLVSSPTPSSGSMAASADARSAKAAAEAFRRRSASRDAGARRIQRAYRTFRAQFPGGRLRSASSSGDVRFQEDPDFEEPLAKGFAEALVRAAKMDPEIRAPVLAAGRQSDFKAQARRRGLVRAVSGSEAPIAFQGHREAIAWAAQGYQMAVRSLDRQGLGHKLLDMERWEVDYLVGKFQMDEAPGIVVRFTGRPLKELLRTVAEKRSLSPKRGHNTKIYRVPIDERMLAEAGNELRIVGGPGDRFRLKPDMRRFLHHALGGFQHYKWQLNPRRRRRVAGRGFQRWILHANHGMRITSTYRILRAMTGWAHRMDRARNWDALFARPLLITKSRKNRRSLHYAVQQLARRLLHDAGVSVAGSREPLPASAGYKLFSSLTTTSTSPDRRSSRSGSRSGSRNGSSGRSGSGGRLPRPSYVVGYMTDHDHAGLFHATLRPDPSGPDGPLRVRVTLYDPHAAITFAPEVAASLRKKLDAALSDLGLTNFRLRVSFARVPEQLALQYGYEGSCGPSSLALIFSMLRLCHPKAPANLQSATYLGVNEEDVVVATQLLHGAVV